MSVDGAIGKPHVLRVLDEFDPGHPGDTFELEHNDDCPTEQIEFETGDGWLEYVCPVGFWADDLLDTFRHSDDTGNPADSREPLTPGIHLIEAWHHVYRNYDGFDEHEGGLRLVEGTPQARTAAA